MQRIRFNNKEKYIEHNIIELIKEYKVKFKFTAFYNFN